MQSHCVTYDSCPENWFRLFSNGVVCCNNVSHRHCRCKTPETFFYPLTMSYLEHKTFSTVASKYFLLVSEWAVVVDWAAQLFSQYYFSSGERARCIILTIVREFVSVSFMQLLNLFVHSLKRVSLSFSHFT